MMEEMTRNDLFNVCRGDILCHANGTSYVCVESGSPVTERFPILVRTIEASNPTEWNLYSKSVPLTK